MKRVVHIGQGKAASTTLQQHVFPAFAKSRQVKYLSPEAITGLIANPADKSAIADDFLASSEVLVGPPLKWDHQHGVNLDFFGAETTILLILRRPSGYLRSVYQQISHHSGVLVDPKTYFAGSDQCLSKLYAPELYDQARLVRLYAESFNEVIVQKFETVADLAFLRVAYRVSDQEMAAARSNLSRKASNHSFSQTAVNISMKLKWMFGAPVVDPDKGTIKRTLRFKLWRSLIQGGFDRIYPYKSYVLDWASVPNIDIGKMDAAYGEMPEFQHYINGVLQPVGKDAR